MTEIADFEQRLAGALDRMAASHARTQADLRAARSRIAELEAAQPAPAAESMTETRELERLLDEARQAAADARRDADAAQAALQAERENLSAIAAQAEADRAAREAAEGALAAHKGGERLGDLKSQHVDADHAARISQLEQALQNLQRANAQLRQNNVALRKAHEAGLPDAGLVDDGLRAELAGLQAARDADRAEIDGILDALRPLIEETADA